MGLGEMRLGEMLPNHTANVLATTQSTYWQ